MKYKINKGFIIEKVGSKATIFDPEESSLHILNSIGMFIFTELKKGKNVTQISKDLAEKYEVTEYKVQRDIKDFIKDLKEKKIIS